MVLDELLEQCRYIKRLVLGYNINAYFKASMPISTDWLEIPHVFPSLRVVNLENIVKLRITVGTIRRFEITRNFKLERLDTQRS